MDGGRPIGAVTNWTRDENGEFVDWTKPPYCKNGLLDLRLKNEEYISQDTHSKRVGEYMKLMKRSKQGDAQ